MTDLSLLYQHYRPDEVVSLLARATTFAKEKPDLTWNHLQNELQCGHRFALIILDWLADNNEALSPPSSHAVRQARQYILNNPYPNLAELQNLLHAGHQRSFQILRILEKRGVIRIKEDIVLERVGRMTSFDGLVRQMQLVSKKYVGRCEPRLLMRTLFVDHITAIRLAQYGEEHLGLVWKDRVQQGSVM